MGTLETHIGFDVVRLKGSIEQASDKVDAALQAIVHVHHLAQRSQDTRLAEELLTVATALENIQTTLGQAATEPMGGRGGLDK